MRGRGGLEAGGRQEGRQHTRVSSRPPLGRSSRSPYVLSPQRLWEQNQDDLCHLILNCCSRTRSHRLS